MFPAGHPADEFEAFKKLADEKGYGAEEIAARFGVSAHVVRQRMRLGAVSPKLLAVYREGALTLDHLMAYAVTEDHARQEQVFESFGGFPCPPSAIRRAMTEAKVHADDKRALFVGAGAYAEAGGTILRDLFTEDGGGWFEDVPLLDRLAAEKLEAIAVELRGSEGWKWVEAHMDFPHAHGLRRVYPHRIERTADEEAEITALSEEYDALTEKWAEVEDLPDDPEAAWAFVVGLDGDSRMALMAHCAGLTVNAVKTWERRPLALAHADVLAQALSLDMSINWTATERSYFGRVTKARIAEAVAEVVGEEAAERIGGMKKQPMAQAAEQLVAGTGWLPPLLRTIHPVQDEDAPQQDGDSEGTYPAAAE